MAKIKHYQRIDITVDPLNHQRIQALSKEHRIAVSPIYRQAISEFLRRLKTLPPPPQQSDS